MIETEVMLSMDKLLETMEQAGYVFPKNGDEPLKILDPPGTRARWVKPSLTPTDRTKPPSYRGKRITQEVVEAVRA